MIYEHYGVEHLHLIEFDDDHFFGKEAMLPGLKQMYVDLGYVDNLDDFNEPA